MTDEKLAMKKTFVQILCRDCGHCLRSASGPSALLANRHLVAVPPVFGEACQRCDNTDLLRVTSPELFDVPIGTKFKDQSP